MKKIIIGTLFSFALLLTNTPLARAAKPLSSGGQPIGGTSVVGNDISYPQCGGRLPSGQAFGIVGVNGGLANTNNPCFTTQLAWAQTSTGLASQPKAALYVNTANPGHASTVWPTSNIADGQVIANPYGTCDGSEGAACAYVYGWTRAYEDATIRSVPAPAAFKWWLDVETANSWSSTDLNANAASLEGMTEYFTSIGAKVGLYSTSYQWGMIVGALPAASNLNGLESWIPGALSIKGAQSNCKNAPLTVGGRVSVTQYVSKRLDYDVACY